MIPSSVSRWRAVLALLLSGASAAAADAPAGPRTDWQGDPLPAEAVARMGSSRLRHTGGVRHLAFTPDGQSLVCAGEHGLHIWDTATGKLRRRVGLPVGRALAFTPTPDGLAVAYDSRQTGDGIVEVFAPDGKVVRRTNLPERPLSPTFSPDGKRLACAYLGGVCVYDAATGREALTVPLAPRDFPNGITFAPDGKSLAVWELCDTVRVYDATSGKPLRTLRRDRDMVIHARFSPDGRWLVTVPYPDRENLDQPGACSVWDVAAGKERHRLKAPAWFVWCAEFSPDGKYLATGGDHRQMVLWDVASGKEVRRFRAAADVVKIAFTPDGRTVATSSSEPGAITLWDVATGRALPGSADPADDTVHGLHFSADGRRLLGSGTVPMAWQPLTGRAARRFPVPPACRRRWLAPDESLIAAADVEAEGGPVIRLSDAHTGKELRVLKGHEKGAVWGVVFLPRGRLASGDSDGMVRVWDVTSGRQLHRLGGGAGAPRLAASADGRWLAYAADAPGPSGHYEVVLWGLADGRERARLPVGPRNGARQVALSPDGRLVAAALGFDPARDGPVPIKVWETAGGRERLSLEEHPSWVVSLAFAPDGRTLAAGGVDGSLCLWELASGRRRHAFAGHETSVAALAFSPDGRLLAASSAEAPVYVWDVTGAYGPALPAPAAAELGRCWDVLMSPDAEAAFRAARRLARAPGAAVPFLRGRLKPVPPVPPERLRRLLAELDGADFAARRRAAAELEELADAAASELRQALAAAPSAELRRALKAALGGLGTARLRALRAVEALEWMGTPEAARLLDELAHGAPGATLTTEAAASRDRLRKLGKAGAP
jgi:WD40 repeat protein